MSFVDRDGVMSLIENLFMYSWPEDVGSVKMPFKLLTYEDAMKLYGTDQPDLRIPYQVRELICTIFYFTSRNKYNTISIQNNFPDTRSHAHV